MKFIVSHHHYCIVEPALGFIWWSIAIAAFYVSVLFHKKRLAVISNWLFALFLLWGNDYD
jgi:hypothetical protein